MSQIKLRDYQKRILKGIENDMTNMKIWHGRYGSPDIIGNDGSSINFRHENPVAGKSPTAETLEFIRNLGLKRPWRDRYPALYRARWVFLLLAVEFAFIAWQVWFR